MPLRRVRLVEMPPCDDDYQRQLEYEQELAHRDYERQLQWEDERQRQFEAAAATRSQTVTDERGDDARDGNWARRIREEEQRRVREDDAKRWAEEHHSRHHRQPPGERYRYAVFYGVLAGLLLLLLGFCSVQVSRPCETVSTMTYPLFSPITSGKPPLDTAERSHREAAIRVEPYPDTDLFKE